MLNLLCKTEHFFSRELNTESKERRVVLSTLLSIWQRFRLRSFPPLATRLRGYGDRKVKKENIFKKLLQTRLICRNNSKKSLGTSNDTYSLSVRVQTTINHNSICFFFLPQYQRQRKCFSSERELKRALRETLTRAAWYGL